MNAIAPFSFGLPDLPWYATLIAVVATLSSGYITVRPSKRNMPARQAPWTVKSIAIAAYLIICLICSAWLVAFGIEAIGTWSIPYMGDNPRPGRRGSGFVIFIIKYWPYASVVIGLSLSSAIAAWFADKPKLKYLRFIWLICAIGVVPLVIHNASVPKVQRSNEPIGRSYAHIYGTIQNSFVDANREFKKVKSNVLGRSNKKFARPHSFQLIFELPVSPETTLYKESDFVTLLLGNHAVPESDFAIRTLPVVSGDSVFLSFELSPQILNSIETDSQISMSIDDRELTVSDELDRALRFIAFDYKKNGASSFAPHSTSDTIWGYTGLSKQLDHAKVDWKEGAFPSHVTDIVVKREPGDIRPKSIVLYLASKKLAEFLSADVLDDISIMINSGFALKDTDSLTNSMTGETEVWSQDRERSVQPCTLATSLFNKDSLIIAKAFGSSMGPEHAGTLDEMAYAEQPIGSLDLDIMPFLGDEEKPNRVEKALVRFGKVEGVLSEDLLELIMEAASLSAHLEEDDRQ